ncbi:hypothetical protein EV182_002965, partial [Spiromyces aspiralis]
MAPPPPVLTLLTRLFNAIPRGADCFSNLMEGAIQMPRWHADHRKLTWVKFMRRLAYWDIVNDVASTDDCWLVRPNTKEGQHITKLSKNGSRSKFATYRLTYLLLHPEQKAILEQRSRTK